jgi:hypothetical protein
VFLILAQRVDHAWNTRGIRDEFIEFSFEKALKKVKIFRIDLRNEIFSDSSSKLAAMLVDGETFFYGMRLMRNLTNS